MSARKKTKLNIVIDKKKIKARVGQTILDVANANGIEIPTLCYHPDLKIKANCRLCLVSIKGRKGLFTSCSTPVEDGMEITTSSPKIKKARAVNLELIFAQHQEECADCVYGFNCNLLKLGKEHKVDITRFCDRKTKFPTYEFGPALIFDSSKCIDCRNCIEACENQNVGFLELQEKKTFAKVMPTCDPKRDCIYCGQCLMHCPVGAFEAVGEFEEVEEWLNHDDKVVVVQFAPSIRVSIGEEFGLPYGKVVTDKLAAGIRKLGVDKVFDTSVGADFTTMEEAKELLEKLEEKCACFSSCCPSWVKYLEFNHKNLIRHIASTRSPQIILGGLIKTYWADKMKIDPEKIYVVSIMPCISKKYEMLREENRVYGMRPVDKVLTTRELAFLFKKRGINLVTTKPEPADDPLGVPSGAGVIYGASGGVAESAIRTAYVLATKGKKVPPRVEFEDVRGQHEMKKAKFDFAGEKVSIAVVNGIMNAEKFLEELKEDPLLYHGVEVMACPGGCIGGGGQPVPSDSRIRKLRARSLYNIDKKTNLRTAHDNPVLKKIYKEYLNTDKRIHEICHTSYSPKKREVPIYKK